MFAAAGLRPAAQYYGVDLSETDWHQLGVHPQQNRKAAAAKAAATRRAHAWDLKTEEGSR
jgi:hypothetical protein